MMRSLPEAPAPGDCPLHPTALPVPALTGTLLPAVVAYRASDFYGQRLQPSTCLLALRLPASPYCNLRLADYLRWLLKPPSRSVWYAVPVHAVTQRACRPGRWPQEPGPTLLTPHAAL
eukprot:4663911-Pleurochrysis_carterae.AAC.1